MKELNPNHPVTNEMRQQWHKLLAITMWKYGVDRLVITSDEIDRFIADHPDGVNVTVEPTGKILTVWIVNDEEGRRLAKREGGLPS